ncbi:cell wall hydrolase [Burkholderia ubonensis]|uniref:N-acetylmuramoyl-L-alanine amidase family protein n=1 Tax=Burkholderia ubonensis TaxID=101571 RepID=UPI000759ECCF|nr:N-acetylmuramoyl-L-alanine amidase [Burkholderia ubonensis]KWE43541.1 cell wall hydrolase [Burkholderia ubonensis]
MNRTVQRLRPFAGAAAHTLACAAMLGMPLALRAADAAPAANAQAPYIVIDTGHTLARPGSTGASGRVEYLYNLDLSSAVARRLGNDGARVLRTAADGREIKLDQRSTQAPDANLFVSIHHDSMQQQFIDAGRQREFRGFSVFVSERNPHYEQSLRCAKAIAGKLVAAGETPSLYHAQPIRGENRPLIDPHLGIHRFDDLVVLRTAPVPAVLVEAGVIVNPDEEKRLAQHDTIQRLSAAIAGGIEACTASE